MAQLSALLEGALIQGYSYSCTLSAVFPSASFAFDPFFFHVSLPSEPASIRNAYNIPTGLNGIGSEGVIVAEFGPNSTINPADLQALCNALSITPCPTVYTFGPSSPYGTNPMSEATLDIQTTVGVGPTLFHGYYSTSSAVTSSTGLLDFLTSLNTFSPKSFVASISYSAPENSWDSSLMSQIQTVLTNLVALGYTIVGSSGDDGVMHSKGLTSSLCNCTSYHWRMRPVPCMPALDAPRRR